MFEFHGWLNICESTCDAEGDEAELGGIVRRANELCLAKSDNLSLTEVRLFNGHHFLLLHGLRNHRQQWVLDLFTSVARSGRGCYGTLHIRDDEDAQYGKEVQLFVARRGSVSRVEETNLSPCMLTLESY